MFMNLSENITELFQDSQAPDVKRLDALFGRAYNNAGKMRNYIDDYAKVRFCNWEGRSKDGRKHGSELKPAFPWNGASDLRVFAIDDVVNKTVASVMRAMWKSRPIGTPRGSSDYEGAQRIASFLESYFKGLPNIRREMKLALNWALSFGISAVFCGWKSEMSVVKRVVDVEEVSKVAGEALLSFLGNEEESGNIESVPEYAAALEEVCEAYALSKSAGKKFLEELKMFGSGEIKAKSLVKDEAEIKTLKLGYDLILPEDVDDIEDSPYVFWVEYLTASEVVRRASARGWNGDFVKALLEDAKSSNDSGGVHNGVKDGVFKSKAYKIVNAFYSCVNKDGELVRRYCVYSPDVSDLYAESDILDLEPMRYPFVLFAAEDVERDLLNSRGFCEIGEGWQREIKTQKDLRSDAAALAINPPKFFKAGAQITQFKPGAFIPMKSGDMRVLEEFRTGPNLAASSEVEDSLTLQMISYFGGKAGETENTDATAQRADMIQDAFVFMGKIYKHLQYLCAQYAPQVINFFDAETSEAEAVQIKREDFAQDMDIVFSYDYNDENFERFVQKFDIAARFVQAFDRNGDVKGLQFLRRLLAGLFPQDSRSFISTEDESTTREVLETQSDLAALYSNQPVNAPEKCNAELRLQIVGQWMQSPNTQARLAQDQEFAQSVQAYADQLQFQLQQRQNAVIGRLGTAPAQGESANMEVLNG